MAKDNICYYCKYSENCGFLCPEYRCKKAGKKVESSDSCNEWEDYEEED